MKRQLVADVPVGVLLSGGVDSSLVTALAAEATPHLRTFTVSFPDAAAHDEAPHAQLVADHFGTAHTVLHANESSMELLPQLAAILDEPVIDSSIIPTFLVSRLVRQHCTVVLGGDGGDELFGGYKSYDRLAWAQSRLQYTPRPLRHLMSGIGTHLPPAFPARNWMLGLGADLQTTLPQLSIFFGPKERRRLLGGRDPASPSAESIWQRNVEKSSDIVDRATRTDFNGYLAEDILVKVDRASMANSLEMRAPFLDRKVLEFAFGRIPADLKATGGKRKILLKALASKLLPASLDIERKQGFQAPLAAWSKTQQLNQMFEATFSRRTGVLDRSEKLALLARTMRTEANAERIFGIFLIEEWAHRYGMSLS